MSRYMTRMMQRFSLGVGTLLLALTVQTAVAQGAATPGYLDTNLTPEQRAADLVHRMTLAEKATQMQNNSAESGGGVSRNFPLPNLPSQTWRYVPSCLNWPWYRFSMDSDKYPL
jgi:hypothetical protein